MWNQFIVGTDYKSFNRTFMELKYGNTGLQSVMDVKF